MIIFLRSKYTLLLLAVLAIGLVCACSSPAPVAPPPPSQPSVPSGTTTQNSPTSGDAPAASGTVKVVYFHTHVRCGPCIYIETRTKYIVETYFKNEVDSGMLTYEVFDLGDKANAGIANKYQAVGSQLFINVVKGGVDNITHIQDVWMPKYLNDQDAYDELIQKKIRQALKEVS